MVYKFDAGGKVLLTLGKKGMAGDNASQELFNRPNAVAIATNGDIYVSDGYNNSRVVHFNKEGKFIRIIGGTKGAEPGQLQLPHGVVVDSQGRILVADSDNKRITVFNKDGKFVENWPFASRGGMVITLGRYPLRERCECRIHLAGEEWQAGGHHSRLGKTPRYWARHRWHYLRFGLDKSGGDENHSEKIARQWTDRLAPTIDPGLRVRVVENRISAPGS